MNIIITGASRGIGKAVAEAFAGEGASLFLCSRGEGALNRTAEELRTAYPSCAVSTLAADLSDKEGAVRFGNWCLESGVPDVVVNNAGSFLPGNIHDEPEGHLESMMATNLYSAYHLTRTLLPRMIATGNLPGPGRHIFNICSIASLQAYARGGSYGISKFALLGFSKNLREELKPHRIKVTAVCPGAVMTDSWGGFDNSQQRIMEATDIAKMILAASRLSPQAVVEEIVMRPLLGDL
jgi:short-subunit dehydrogenase